MHIEQNRAEQSDAQQRALLWREIIKDAKLPENIQASFLALAAEAEALVGAPNNGAALDRMLEKLTAQAFIAEMDGDVSSNKIRTLAEQLAMDIAECNHELKMAAEKA